MKLTQTRLWPNFQTTNDANQRKSARKQFNKSKRKRTAQCGFFAQAFTSGVPMFFGAQGSPFSVDASTCAATQQDGVLPTAPFCCANAPADEDMTPGRSPDHKRKATAQDSPSELIAVEEDEGDIAATPVRHTPEKRSSRSNPTDLLPGLLGVPSARGSGLDGPVHAARPLRQSKKSKIQDFSEVFRAGLDMFSAQSSPATHPAANQCFFIADEGHSLVPVGPVFFGNHTDSSSLPPDAESVPFQPDSCSKAQDLGRPVILTPSVQI